MKCDLCNKNISSNNIFSYEEVEDSKLCSACYEKVTGKEEADIKVESTSSISNHTPNYYTEREDDSYSEHSLTRCNACSATFDNTYVLCPTCGHEIKGSNDGNNSKSNPSPKLVISTILFIVSLVIFIKIASIGISFIVFGPSILAICIVLFIAPKSTSLFSRIALTLLALTLHGISTLFIFAAVGIGEAWSGYSSSHDFPKGFGMFGALIVVFVSLFRSSENQKK